MDWWKTFFNPEYYGPTLENFPEERTTQEMDFILQLLKPRKNSSILDLCCGTGRHAIELARRGYKVTGLDYNKRYLETARKNAAEANVKPELIRGDMRKSPGKGVFDATINLFTSFGFFEKDTENFKVLAAVARCLKPGGRFLIDVMNRDWLIRNLQETDWSEEADGYCLQKRSFDIRDDTCHMRWVWVRGGVRTEHEGRIKFYPYSTYKREFERRGMRIVDCFGGYDGSEFGLDARRMIILAEKRK